MIFENVCLKEISYLKTGGKARYFARVKKIKDLEKVINYCQQKLKKEIFILSGATNTLIKEGLIDKLIIKPEFCFLKNDSLIEVGSGIFLMDFIDYLASKGFSGLEQLAGIPGTIGGAIYQNASAFNKEIKENLVEVYSLDFSKTPFKIRVRKVKECRFGYRQSIFQKRKEIILKAKFFFKKKNSILIKRKIKKYLDYRQKKHPLEYPSLGSTFLNIPINQLSKNFFKKYPSFKKKIKNNSEKLLPVALLINELNLAGLKIGGAMISLKHPNFIINFSEAKTEDFLKLIKLIKKRTKEKFKIKLKEEIRYLS